MLRARSVSLLVIVTVLASACAPLADSLGIRQALSGTGNIHPVIQSLPWVYADLRAYDTPDDASPGADIVAVYARLVDSLNDHRSYGLLPSNEGKNELQIRLDFLDLPVQSQCDIYLLMDYKPGGSLRLPWGDPSRIEWDALVKIPATGEIEAWDDHSNPVRNLAIRITRDSTLDLLAISMSTEALPGVERGARVEAYTILPGETNIADQLAPFRLDAFPPAQASILFAFWNSLPAYTPAQALRRWDGAHTGPLGGRHGLYNLLRAARGYSIPLLLVDLKSPTSLAALDYLDGLPLVRKSAFEGLLILPEMIPIISNPGNLPDEFTSLAAEFSRTTSLGFNLPASQFIYATMDSGLPGEYPNVIVRAAESPGDNPSLPGLVYPTRWREKWILPIPEHLASGQATEEGFSPETRIALVQAAIAAVNPEARSKPAILVLGGDLPSSEWGVPQIARSTFRYLRAHPWMHVLDANDLISLQTPRSDNNLPAQPEPRFPPKHDEMIRQLVSSMIELSPSPLQRNVWLALFSLFAPAYPSPEELPALRTAYIGQLNPLIVAAKWAENPLPISSCEMDLDFDGRPECLLASDRVFIVIKLDSGAIVYAFASGGTGVHQIIAPSSQFAVGTGNPALWDLTRGWLADPEVIPGAFSDDSGPYSYDLKADRLSLVGNGIVKTYQLTPQGLRVEYQSRREISTQIPLALDPWIRSTPGWGEQYFNETIPGSWAWEIKRDLRVVIRTNATSHPITFTETKKYLSLTEDPNRDYPPGHFLPFPLAVISIRSAGDFILDMQWETAN